MGQSVPDGRTTREGSGQSTGAEPLPLRPADSDIDRFARGGSVARYVILEEVGVGGMGVVHRAYDPKLQREVALKRVRLAGSRDELDTEAEARLLREAQAMAQLSHPNVIPVYDVDRLGDELVLAMEFVDGETLRAWLDPNRGQRTWREIVKVFRDAGRGLAAAHGVGLVHRDFKPTNVLIGSDERVRVLDFGLARPADLDDEDDQRTSRTQTSDALSSADRDTGRLTEAGVVLGTPAYMAPEQHRGLAADERSDQYGYCIALWEALFGRRPFSGSWDDLLLEKQRAKLTVPAGSRVPDWLVRVIGRGLAPNPELRWPSMDALLTELDRDPRRKLRRWLAAGAVATTVAGTVAAANWLAAVEAEKCRGGDQRLAAVWDADRRVAAQAAILGTGVPYAASTWERSVVSIDTYAGAWVDMHREACEATQRGEQSAAHLDLRMRCLDHRLVELHAMVDTWLEADDKVVENAVLSVSRLPRVARCADPAYVEAQVRPPDAPEVEAAVERMRADLSRAKALNRAGKYTDGIRVARSVLERAEAVGFRPFIARVQLALGVVLSSQGQYDESRRRLEQAFFGGRRHGIDVVAASAASNLVFVVGAGQAKSDEGMAWAEHASAEVDRLDDPRERAQLHASLGNLFEVDGDYEEALTQHLAALELRESTVGLDHPHAATSLNNLGNVHEGRGEYDLALAYFQRAHVIWERALGPDHPRIAASLNNLGNATLSLGDPRRALPLYLRALEIGEPSLGKEHPTIAANLENLALAYRGVGENLKALNTHHRAMSAVEHTLGTDHPRLATSFGNIAVLHQEAGEMDKAEAYYLRALAVAESRLGTEHPTTATLLNNIANLYRNRAAYDVALAHHHRALASRVARLGPNHPDVAMSLANMGNVLNDQQAYSDAEPYFRRAHAIWERALPPRHPWVIGALSGVGKALLGANENDAAADVLEQVVAMREQSETKLTSLADAHFALAQALWQSRRDRKRALELARAARDEFRRAGDSPHNFLAEVETWLRRVSPSG